MNFHKEKKVAVVLIIVIHYLDDYSYLGLGSRIDANKHARSFDIFFVVVVVITSLAYLPLH